MMRAANTQRQDGYSLVELLLGILAAAILALTAGTMLFHAYDAWDDNHAAVNLHRDGRNAMDLITRAIRLAAEDDVVAAPDSLTISNIRISNAAGLSTVRFSTSGRDLLFDPDTSVAGNDVTLIAAATDTFVVDLSVSGAIGIELGLARDDERIQFEALAAFRN
jgi:Tfp pilus assembly protein PilW